MGDVIHALPALTDASRQLPGATFDWLVEEGFKDIPAAHPAVGRVLPVALRRWRRSPLKTLRGKELGVLRDSLRERSYDLVIDAQGLLKSAILAALVPAPVIGLDKQSLREPLARVFYDHKVSVPRNMHAVERIRQLFAQALHYALPATPPEYGLRRAELDKGSSASGSRRIFFLHGTTWPSKHWPEQNWRHLATVVGASGYEVVIPWNTSQEQDRALRIADQLEFVRVLPRMDLIELMDILANAAGAFCVDTGLGHLATALGLPTMAFYGPTDPTLTGNYGPGQIHCQHTELNCVPCLRRYCRLLTTDTLVQPCFSQDNPESLWTRMQATIEAGYPAAGEPDKR